MTLHPARPVSRRVLLGTTAVVPIGLLAACGEDPPVTAGGAPTEVSYLTNFGQFGRDSYAYLASDRGRFTDAGLAVSIQPGSGTGGNVAALLSGQAQFATVDLAGAAITAAEQGGFVTIGAVHQRALAALMAYEDSGIRQPYDLAGARVGLPAGAVTELLFPAYLELAELVAAGQVEQVALEPAQLVPALASGQVDAIGQFVVGRPLVEAAGGGRQVVVLPYSDYLDDLYGTGLCTTVELAEREPELCVAFRDALLGGLAEAMDDPQAAAEALAAHVPETDPEVAAAEMTELVPYVQTPEGVPLGHIDRQRLARHIAVLEGAGLLGDRPLAPEELAAFPLVPGGES